MDPIKRNFSFPNSDQYTGQSTSSPNVLNNLNNREEQEESPGPKRTINIMDALANAKKDGDDVQTVRTYQSDIANTIKNDNVSMIKVALSEKKRQERRGSMDNTLEENNKNLYLVIAAIIAFIVIAGLIAGYIFLQSQNKAEVAQQEQQKVQPLLYTEVVSVLNIDEININDLTKLIEKDREAVMDLGSMKSIVLTAGSSTSERQITSEELFNLLNTRAPDGLVRSLNPNFLLGVYAYNTREMFLVFNVSSYDSAFAGMLEWEPNIESDIGDLFINKRDQISRNITSLSNTQSGFNLNTSSTSAINLQGVSSTSTSSTTNDSPFGVFSQRKFIDKIVSNKDARVLVDSNGKQAMLYTFLDKQTLVISTSEKSLQEIIFRLTTGRIVR